MKTIKSASFSLLTAFFLLTIVALSVSHFAVMRRLDEAREEVWKARAEVDVVRKEFGYIQADDPHRIYVSRIEGDEPAWKLTDAHSIWTQVDVEYR